MANAQTLAERQQNMKMQVKSLPRPRLGRTEALNALGTCVATSRSCCYPVKQGRSGLLARNRVIASYAPCTRSSANSKQVITPVLASNPFPTLR